MSTITYRKPVITYSRASRTDESVQRMKRRRLDSDSQHGVLAQSITPLNEIKTPEFNIIDVTICSPNTSRKSPTKSSSKKTFSFFAQNKIFNIKTKTSNSKQSTLVTLTKSFTTKTTKTTQTSLRQLQIDLDGNGAPRITCKACGMQYTPSCPEDAKVHKKFHAKNVGGIDLGFVVKPETRVWNGDVASRFITMDSGLHPKIDKRLQKLEGSEKDYIVEVNRRSSYLEKKKAVEVMEYMKSELSAVDIPEADLWSVVDVPNVSNNNVVNRTDSSNTSVNIDKPFTEKSDRFKVYMYISGKKCVGLCVAERISAAHNIDESQPKSEALIVDASDSKKRKSSSISILSTSQPATLGISRIWTCSSYRRLGIASRLVDTARKRFIYGMEINKSRVAFSQPTETGGHFAKSWSESSVESTDDVEVHDLQMQKKRRLLVYVEG